MLSLSDLRIVVMNCPYDTWDTFETRDLFGKMVALKLRGYRLEYGYGVLPLDTSDFVGCHYMLCLQTDGRLDPIQACKMISQERCRTHGITFPPIAMASTAGAQEHVKALQEISSRCEREGISLSYDSSWTIEPDVRRLREDRQLLRDLLTATIVLVHQKYEIEEAILGGVLRFKTPDFFTSWGFHPLEYNGGVLPPLGVSQLVGEPVILMHRGSFSSNALSLAAKYLWLWEGRLTIELLQTD